MQVHVWDFELPGPTQFQTGIYGIWPRFVAVHFETGIGSPLYYQGCRKMAESLADHSISHGNDSFCWVVTQLSGMNVKVGYKVYTLGSGILGFTAMIILTLISLFM
jgi:hypothetical protein